MLWPNADEHEVLVHSGTCQIARTACQALVDLAVFTAVLFRRTSFMFGFVVALHAVSFGLVQRRRNAADIGYASHCVQLERFVRILLTAMLVVVGLQSSVGQWNEAAFFKTWHSVLSLQRHGYSVVCPQ